MCAVVVVLATACGGAARHTAPRAGSIIGLARDHDSGDPIAKVDVHLRAQGNLGAAPAASSNAAGWFSFEGLASGTYSVSGVFAGQPIDIDNIEVRTGEVSYLELTFTLGRPDPIHLKYGDQSAAIDRYRPKGLADGVGRFEGTVNDSTTHTRVSGAVVTAIGPGNAADAQVLNTVSDDAGRYHFDAVVPGTYLISAYYSVGGRGQIEIRRSDITIAAGEAVIVPLWVEMAR